MMQQVDHSAWRLRAWNDTEFEDYFLELGIIAIGAGDMPNLTHWPGDSVILERLRTAHPDRRDTALRNFVRYWRVFRLHLTPGDLVAVPLSDSRVAIGEIIGDYQFTEEAPHPRLRHRRAMKWHGVIPRAALETDLRRVVNAPGTICQFRAPAAAARLALAAGTR